MKKPSKYKHMTAEQFCFWLQGKLEGRKLDELTDLERNIIQFHLDQFTGLKTTT